MSVLAVLLITLDTVHQLVDYISSDNFFLSFVTDSLIHEHFTRECEFGNFDKIKKKNITKNNTHKKTQKLLAEILFK